MMRLGTIALSIAALSLPMPTGAVDQEAAVGPAMMAWLQCVHGNSSSEVTRTPANAVEIGFANCRQQESRAIREAFPAEAASPSTVDFIRTRLRAGIRTSLIARVAADRASDPEMHAQFADQVNEDALSSPAISSAPMDARDNQACAHFAVLSG